MNPFKPKATPRDGPERKIQDALKIFLKLRDWYVKETHGNMYQSGLPDLYAAHRKYGARWIEVKNLLAYAFTPAQIETFHMMIAHGVGVWVLVADTEEEYQKLFKPPNYYQYLKF